MRTLTTTVQITVRIAEYDESGLPKTPEDELCEGIDVIVQQDGRDISDRSELRGIGSDVKGWELRPNEDGLTLSLEFGYC